MSDWRSFGRWPRVAQRALDVTDRAHPFARVGDGASALPRGAGRSYGDSCLASEAGVLLATRRLDRFLAFDREAGVIRCEAGVTLADILAATVPHGWFLPVTPGTQHVTVGGAVANDVHGKNHHRAGTFGDHVRALTLARSDGSVEALAGGERFAATIGGLGLTGFVVDATLALRRVASDRMTVTASRFATLAEYFERMAAAEMQHEHAVAWLDCASRGPAFGRGVLYAADHAQTGGFATPRRRSWPFPVALPASAVNRLTVRAFNAAYFAAAPATPRTQDASYEQFFYPLDRVAHWNRAYGRAGFLQHQCVVPPAAARDAVPALLAAITRSGEGSMLVVLKNFGERAAPGLLSFARAGTTLALDFPFRGERTLALLERLDAIVREARGAVYPAKDARMSAATFAAGYPALEPFRRHVDPRLRSRFAERVGLVG